MEQLMIRVIRFRGGFFSNPMRGFNTNMYVSSRFLNVFADEFAADLFHTGEALAIKDNYFRS